MDGRAAYETGKLFRKCAASGQKGPTPLHVEIKLLPGGIGSLIGVPTALIGTQVAFADVVAEPLEHGALSCQQAAAGPLVCRDNQ